MSLNQINTLVIGGAGFIATAMASVMRGMPIKIFGLYGTVRDYSYVNDLGPPIVSALEYGHLSAKYNLGSGIGFTNTDVVVAFSPLLCELGYEVEVENFPERAFDVKVNVLDSTRPKMDTGWKPRVVFREGAGYYACCLERQLWKLCKSHLSA
jgi:UDP-glucose 4-epimerase